MSYYLGIDAGSISVKMALINDERKVVDYSYTRHKGQPAAVANEKLAELLEKYPAEIKNINVCGSAGKLIANLLDISFVNEIVSQSKAVGLLYPHVRSVIEIGGEDSKLILLTKDSKIESMIISDFAMNTLCAAGTGSFLDQQANRLGVSIEEEFGHLALKSKNPPRIAGRCSVFAKTDMIHLQQQATPDYDIVAGLCFALARNFVSNIAKGKKFVKPVAFHGGVATNAGMIRAFTSVLELEEGELFVPSEHAVMGAIGTALMAKEENRTINISLDKMEEYLKTPPEQEEGLAQLVLDEISKSYGNNPPVLSKENKVEAYLGVDIGSISTNLVILDKNKNVLAKRYLMTAGRPIEAVRTGLTEIGEEIGGFVEIKGVCTTGSGRYLIGDFLGADVVKNEITAQARAAIEIDPKVDTIFEIGGQDSKYISIEDGAIIDFEMNKVCAAGTGSFLEEQAEKLGINIKEEFGCLALGASRPVQLGERCTVFMESDLVHHQQKGAQKDDLVAGLSYSIVYNYLNRVVGDKKVGDHIFFQGGVAFNKGVVAAFEQVTGKKITVPEHHEVTGAIGCALIALENAKHTDHSNFKGFDLSKRHYDLDSFECKGCANNCEINKVVIAGEKPLFYGSRCEKYELDKKAHNDHIPDLFKEREQYLLGDYKEEERKGSEKVIGIPRILHFYEYFPFWYNFFKKLGLKVVLSDATNKKIINTGLEHVLAESCFPVKVSHGHIFNLVEKKVDYIFLPSILNLQNLNSGYAESVACPYVQAVPYILGSAIDIEAAGVKVLNPVVEFDQGEKSLFKSLQPLTKEFKFNDKQIKEAIKAGNVGQQNFFDQVKKRGKEVLDSLNADQKGIVIISRPYNGCDPGINLELPKKLKDLGSLAIPLDFLPVDDVDLSKEWPSMTWRYGQKILSAGEIIRKDPRLNALYISNFGCGPDSFLLKFFRTKMGGKVYLQIEVDEHNADVGAITRCEAFLDSLENIKKKELHDRKIPYHTVGKNNKRTIFIPYMCDHAHAIKYAFLANDVPAEVYPESNDETLIWGRKFTTGKECYPCIVTTGDMVRIIKRPDFNPDKSAFFMPTAGGGCRFGYYNTLQRLVLDELGYGTVPILSPNQNTTLYDELGVGGPTFLRKVWHGLVAVDLLYKALYETRPYELNQGETNRVYQKFLDETCQAILNNKSLLEVMKNARKGFQAIKVDKSELRPRIGVVGEIFVRLHKFSNNFIAEELEKLGAEVWVAPFTEWIFYVNWLRQFKLKKNESISLKYYNTYLKAMAEDAVQRKDEHDFVKIWDGFLDSAHEPPIEKNVEYGSAYFDPSFEGEAILSVGKATDYAKRGISGIVNLMPFTCMPGTIVTSVLKKFRENNDNLPCITVAYDGLQQTKTGLRLEAFVHQCHQYKMSHDLVLSKK